MANNPTLALHSRKQDVRLAMIACEYAGSVLMPLVTTTANAYAGLSKQLELEPLGQDDQQWIREAVVEEANRAVISINDVAMSVTNMICGLEHTMSDLIDYVNETKGYRLAARTQTDGDDEPPDLLGDRDPAGEGSDQAGDTGLETAGSATQRDP